MKCDTDKSRHFLEDNRELGLLSIASLDVEFPLWSAGS